MQIIRGPVQSWRYHWPLLATTGLLCLFLAAVIARAAVRMDGHFLYALDDAYIHMAIAKNLAQHGVWGVTRYEFSPAASSILWPLILALCRWLFGLDDFAPLVLNIIFAFAFLYFASVVFRSAGLTPWPSFLALLTITFVMPLPALIVGGMEHVLQTLVTTIFVYVTARIVSQDLEPLGRRQWFMLLLLAPLVTMIRYEGVIVVGVACLMLLIRRQLALAMTVGLSALAPLVVFSLISLRNGAMWLPSPVLLKGNVVQTAAVSGMTSMHLRTLSLFDRLLAAPYLWLLVLGTLVLSLGPAGIRTSRECRTLAILFALITLLHIRLAAVGWLFRYEAYLVALGLFVVFLGAGQSGWSWTDMTTSLHLWLQRVAALILALLVAYPFADRLWMANRHLPNEFPLYYQLTYQEARFLDTFYRGQAVALTDIGAPTYFADIRCLDLFGLASVDVARARIAKQWRPNDIRRMAHAKDVEIAIVNHRFFVESVVPKEWVKVGDWRTSAPSTPDWSTGVFYATGAGGVQKLARNLRDFAGRLPSGVTTVVDPDVEVSK
jgi:hypothetical protein